MDLTQELSNQDIGLLRSAGIGSLEDIAELGPAAVVERISGLSDERRRAALQNGLASLLWRHVWLDDAPITDSSDPRLDGWYHTIDFGAVGTTRGFFDHRPVVDRYEFPSSLEGMDCLDVGSADGFFSFELERRGAKSVTAIDIGELGDSDMLPHRRARLTNAERHDTSVARRFEIARRTLGSNVRHTTLNVYDLSPDTIGQFDFVFCGSLLLHLMNPLAALLAIRSVTKSRAIIETGGMHQFDESDERPLMRFGARDAETFPGEMTIYWRMNRQALEDLACYAGFSSARSLPRFAMPTPGGTVENFDAQAVHLGVVDGALMPCPTPSATRQQLTTAERVGRLFRQPRYTLWRAWESTLDRRG